MKLHSLSPIDLRKQESVVQTLSMNYAPSLMPPHLAQALKCCSCPMAQSLQLYVPHRSGSLKAYRQLWL